MSPSLIRVRSALAKTPKLRAFVIAASSISVVGVSTFYIATAGQKFHPLDEIRDALALSPELKRYNPHSNKTLSDIYEARIPIRDVDPDLIADFEQGGSNLVERYCSGLLGGWGFAIARSLAIREAKKTGPRPGELYTKEQILNTTFEPGTGISHHFDVLHKTPQTILLRGGSPSDANGLRDVDSMLQGVVNVERKSGVAVFQLKCVFYNGKLKGSPPPLPSAMMPLHLIYARSLAANGVANCKR